MRRFLRDAREVARRAVAPVPLLQGANYHVVAAILAKKQDNFLTRYFGDGMVPARRAAGRSFRKLQSIPFPKNSLKTLRGLSHSKLARHPEVYAHIRSRFRAKVSS